MRSSIGEELLAFSRSPRRNLWLMILGDRATARDRKWAAATALVEQPCLRVQSAQPMSLQREDGWTPPGRVARGQRGTELGDAQLSSVTSLRTAKLPLLAFQHCAAPDNYPLVH